MTQINLPVMVSPTPGATLVENLENWRDALHSMHSGASRPDYVVPQMMWIDTSEAPWVLKVFQGSDDIILGNLDPVTLNFTPSNVDGQSISGVLAANVTATNTNGLTSTNVQGQLDELASPFTGKAVGEIFFVSDDLDGADVPDNSGTRKYVRLTAGQDGAGGFNEGLLDNEVVTGSGATLVVTADILVGPMTGETIHLINSMDAVLRASETSGVFQQDQMQQITGRFRTIGTQGTGAIAEGAFELGSNSTSNGSTIASAVTLFMNFDSSNVARTGDRTRDKSVSATHYMRIV